MNKKNIAIVAGGDSSEAVISFKSAQQIAEVIDRDRYNAYTIFIKGTEWTVKQEGKSDIAIDKNDFTFVENGAKVAFDCVLMMIHGTPGENGILQAYFDLIRLPYTGCRTFTSALTFDKYATKKYLEGEGVDMARGFMFRKGQQVDADALVEELGLPMFVKPNASGSSFGVTKVKSVEQLQGAIDAAFTEGDAILIEESINGIELGNGLIKTPSKALVFPVTEIVPKTEFFDFEAKYTSGMSEEITPARIPDEVTERVQELSSHIYDVLGCRGIVRVDYIYSNDKLYFIEINTIPGMSQASIVPQQVRTMGLELRDVLTLEIEDAIERF